MKYILAASFVFGFFYSFSQKSGELLVYSLKGKATLVVNKKESALKIGRKLPPAAIIKTEQGAQVIMVCSQGIPLSITKKGSFPVSRWKDSCKIAKQSLTQEYFKYIWSQMLGEKPKRTTGGNDKVATGMEDEYDVLKKHKKPLLLVPGISHLRFSAGGFLLKWTETTSPVSVFILSNAEGNELFRDSISGNAISIVRLLPFIPEGSTCYWKVSSGNLTMKTPGILQKIKDDDLKMQIARIENGVSIPENLSERYFRTAYMLEQQKLIIDAYSYYQLAANEPDAIKLYKDRLTEFSKKYSF
jgi:hypothetical protein